MKPRVEAIALAISAAGAVLLVGIGLRWVRGPSRETIRAHFEAHRGACVSLRALITDQQLNFVTYSETGLRTDPVLVDESLRAATSAAFDACGSFRVVRHPGNLIRFDIFAFGFPGTDRALGFAWTEHAESTQNFLIFERFDGPWATFELCKHACK